MKKAMVFGQNVTTDSKDCADGTAGAEGNGTVYKVDPSVVFGLYRDWVVPLTKSVEIEYLLHRLD